MTFNRENTNKEVSDNKLRLNYLAKATEKPTSKLHGARNAAIEQNKVIS